MNLILAILSSVVIAGQVCPQQNSFCVVAQTQGSDTCFTIHSSFNGWNGIGIGSTRMKGADMYIGWTNSTGGVTVGNFLGGGHSQPPVNTVQNHRVVSLMDPKPSWSQLSFSFCRPTVLSSNGQSVTPTAGFIYGASGNIPTGNLDDINKINLLQHDANDAFQPDFSASNVPVVSNNGGSNTVKPILTPSSNFSLQSVIITHGVLMFIAWAVSPFIGIYIARYLKSALGHTWYILHVFFMAVLTGVATLVSFILIFLYSADRFSNIDAIGNAHEKIGLVVVVAVVIQIILGYISNAKFDPDRPAIPWWDQAHWWLGRSLFLLGLVNVYLGIAYYSRNYDLAGWVLPVFWIVIAVGIAGMIYGQATKGQDNHVKSTEDSRKIMVSE
ncbi:hypothetical protein HK103_003107 [Boothiomyces macroporosus]|uniref:Cytochrome b561 domain-containing protein n=1 Tax=Boothiomyces macroporosus TaxID=261099 RepID=A0AAD5UKQ1_9FUNG|nr:hypothetical protein HK103_003107 [Boothiomyces macroporosus]